VDAGLRHVKSEATAADGFGGSKAVLVGKKYEMG
jgi:hypothetical protein